MGLAGVCGVSGSRGGLGWRVARSCGLLAAAGARPPVTAVGGVAGGGVAGGRAMGAVPALWSAPSCPVAGARI